MFKVVSVAKGGQFRPDKLTLKPIGPVLPGAKLERNATGEIAGKGQK
jgi:hypothetical protein